jgi:putative ATP-binding cassette transporter
MFAQAQIAMQRIDALSRRFDNPGSYLPLTDAEHRHQPIGKIDRIGMRNVRFSFPSPEAGQGFSLGPATFELNAGEITFITGENGGGKTTLMKLLLGLYTPNSGNILLNGSPVTTDQADDYRQSFATIFSDYFLFDELRLPAGVQPEQVISYLERLEIAHKVTMKDGRFTTTDLSTGQRKRLALMHAWVEGRPFLVFDEWAADQDPAFRRVFYTEILPDLRRQGRTVIAISHDDRYFYIADKIITLHDGQVIKDVGDTGAPQVISEAP